MAERQNMVPESKLIAAEKRIEKLRKELDLFKADGVEEGSVRQYLMDRADELAEIEQENAKLREELDERQASLDKRDKEATIQSLISRYAPTGDDEEVKKSAESFQKAITEASDPEKEALRLYAERLAKEKEQPLTPAEEAFDRTPAGAIIRKQPKDMNDEELAAFEASEKAKYFAKQAA